MINNVSEKMPPVFSFVGSSGSGKTTFIEKLLPFLINKGLKVGVIKHDAHKFEIDKPGKDSYRLKHAGAKTVVLSSEEKMAFIKSFNGNELSVEEIILRFFSDADLIITEGYKKSSIPKFEVFRKETGKPPVMFNSPYLLGIITDDNINTDKLIFGLNDIEKVADYIINLSFIQKSNVVIEGNADELLKNAILDIAKSFSFFESGKKIKINIEIE
jgi:molybdopterin-guanine dinucleotide biosynthesis protein MobB